MDYSLLVGIHNLDEAQREKTEARKQAPDSGNSDDDDGEPKKSGLNRTRSVSKQIPDRTGLVQVSQQNPDWIGLVQFQNKIRTISD